MRQRAALILVIVAAAAVYLIGNASVPLWDRDEPRNAQAARQMYQSGDWVVPRFLDKVRTAKPVFTYWCQASAMHVLGDTVFAARLPSAIAMMLTLIVLACVLRRYVDAERAFWTVFILATSAIVIGWTAKTSLHDSVLLLWIVIAQLALFALLTGKASWRAVIIMSIGIGMAGLSKGPVVLGVMGMTLLAWRVFRYFSGTGAPPVLPTSVSGEGGLRATLKVLVGLLIITAIVGPWLYLIEHRVPGFIRALLFHDVLQRMTESLEQHKGPPGYYALVLWGIYFPWSVLLPLTFVLAWKHRDDPRVRFALCATIGPWLMFECVQTKLPHYLLPIFPPLAFLTADAIVRCLKGEHGDLTTKGTRAAIVVWTFIVLIIIFATILVLPREKGLTAAPAVVFPTLLLTAAYAAFTCWFFLQRRPAAGLVTMGVGFLLVIALLMGLMLPSIPALRLSIDIANTLKQNGGGANATRAGDVQMIQYKEPSLAFYQGGTIREQSENDFLITHPPSDWPKFMVIREDVWKRMPALIQQQWEVLGQPRGLDLPDRGRTWTVYVLKKR